MNSLSQLFQENLIDLVHVPGGTFQMGSSKAEYRSFDCEKPAHNVAVPPFFMGKYPITQFQWQLVATLPQEKKSITLNPSRFEGNQNPVERVSWLEAKEFCLRLSTATGHIYRLPSEAEWEYACRAGTQTPFYFGETITGNLANYDSKYTYQKEKKVKYRGQTTPVGQFPPNAFGLHDMHGNVWELCLDNYSKYDSESLPTDGSAWLTKNENDSHILRGGSWFSCPWLCRSACRDVALPFYRSHFIGFRIVREI